MSIEHVDTSFLQSLYGYNMRRATLVMMDCFMTVTQAYDLKPVEFSILSLIRHNPGITSRQLCDTLALLPPNLVGIINALEERALLVRLPHPTDKRAYGLRLTASGKKRIDAAEVTASTMEVDVTSRLTETERKTFMRLLQKIYL